MLSGTIVTYEKWGRTGEVEGKQQEGGSKTAERVAHVSFWKGGGGSGGGVPVFLADRAAIHHYFVPFFVRDCPHRSTPGPLSDRQEVQGGGSSVQKVCAAELTELVFFLQRDLMKRRRSKKQLLILFPLPF